jgi:hypothetical protein
MLTNYEKNMIELSKNGPFGLNKNDKYELLLKIITELNQHHIMNCKTYSNICTGSENYQIDYKVLSSFPYVAARIFKLLEMHSLGEQTPAKILNSSATTSQIPAKIFLDKLTSKNQTIVLSRIVGNFIGKKRLPMLIIDSEETLKKSGVYSARAAGIAGFSSFANDRCFVLNSDLSINEEKLKDFMDKYSNSDFVIFGFTFVFWNYFILELVKRGYRIDLSNGILIHGGGWKKLESSLQVSKGVFKEILKESFNLKKMHDYYGMVEQVGSIFFECEEGYFHSSIYSDIFIRDPFTFEVLNFGNPGILQCLSVVPLSYPGHNILTEDEAVIVGEDDCKCQRLGKYFLVLGRLPKAELRGCSDTFQI